MAQDDAAHRRQADAGARELAGAVQALEGAEQAIGEAHVEAGAVVAHREGRRLVRMTQERDPRRLGVAGVLPGVAEQVLEHHAQQRRVAGGGQAGLDLDLDLAVGREAPQVLDHVAGEQREIDRRPRQRLRRQPREREQRIDHVVHPRRRAEHPVEVVDADAAEDGAVVLLDDPGEAFDDADRRAQVVRDDAAELRILDRPRRGGRARRSGGAPAQQPPGAGGADGGGREQGQGDRQGVRGADQHGDVALRIGRGAFATRSGGAARDIDNDCRQRTSPARFKSARFPPKIGRSARLGASASRCRTRAMSPNIEKVTA